VSSVPNSHAEAEQRADPAVFGFHGPVQRGTRLSSAVAGHIESLVVNGALVPGMMLPPERVLSEAYGVSRTVTREAMKSLEQEGLVEILHGKGVRVSAKSADSVAHSLEKYILGIPSPLWSLLELRRLVEIGAAALAAERRTEAEMEELDSITAQMRDSLDDPRKYAELDLELHRVLYRATQNPLVAIVLEPFMRLLRESRQLGALARQAPRRSIDVHLEITDAIRRGDGRAARAAMATHFDRVEQFLAESVTRPRPRVQGTSDPIPEVPRGPKS
jgi:GntR family transcriptional regulator, transcriptional repressor for pyruvate dehydrogenase complex